MKTRYLKMFCWSTMIIAGLEFTSVCLADTSKLQRLSVVQAVQIAMEHNLQRQMSQEDVSVAQDKVGQSQSAFGPKVNLGGGYYHYNDQPGLVKLEDGLVELNNGLASKGFASFQSAPDMGLNYYGLQISLEQPLYTGNKLTATHKQAQANLAHAEADLGATNNNLIFQVKKAYYTVLLCRQLEVAMDQACESMENHRKEAGIYYKAGIAPYLDVLRAEEKLADLQQKQLLAHNNTILAKSSLNFVLGIDLGTEYDLDDQISYRPLTGDLGLCQQTALANRPELVASKAQVEMARQAVAIIDSDYKPTVALVTNGHHYEPNNESPSVTIGIVATMKVYDSQMTKNKIAEAEAVLKKATIGQDLLQRSIKLEVEQAYRNTQVALQSIEVAKKSLTQAEETLRTADDRYKVQLSTSVERIDAELGLTQAKTNYTKALSMYNIALAQLDQAMGI
jgi:outer membrane protein